MLHMQSQLLNECASAKAAVHVWNTDISCSTSAHLFLKRTGVWLLLTHADNNFLKYFLCPSHSSESPALTYFDSTSATYEVLHHIHNTDRPSPLLQWGLRWSVYKHREHHLMPGSGPHPAAFCHHLPWYVKNSKSLANIRPGIGHQRMLP